jgi:cyclophilin family peptidyl-prolyl cis-trans isomerase
MNTKKNRSQSKSLTVSQRLAISATVLVAVVLMLYLPQLRGQDLAASLIAQSPIVEMETDLGVLKLRLNSKAAPLAVENFVNLAQDGKFNNMSIHEVKRGLYIQTGDYENGDGTGGKSTWGQPFKDEFSKDLSHVRGVVSMANLGPDSNASQFFILLDDRAYLDGRHTIIGEVVSGLEVADLISQVDTDNLNQPVEPVMVRKSNVQ